MENVYLIGMPGCGKSKLGQEAAKRLSMEFIDTDEVTIKKAGVKDMNELFQVKGVKMFRRMEKETISEVSKKTDCIVSTGGGVVLDDDNCRAMINTGRVVFVDVNLTTLRNRIDANTRPLVQNIDSALEQLYFHRYDKYKNSATDIFDNNGELEESIEAFIKLIKE